MASQRKRNESSTWNKCTALTMRFMLRTFDMEDKLEIERAMKQQESGYLLLFDLIHFLQPIKMRKNTTVIGLRIFVLYRSFYLNWTAVVVNK